MFANLSNLIEAKKKEMEGYDLLLAAANLEGPAEKTAGNLTSFLDIRNNPVMSEEARGTFVSQLVGADIPGALDVIRKEVKDIDTLDDSHKLQGLKHLLSRWGKLLEDLRTVARSVHMDDPTRGDKVMDFVHSISASMPRGQEDQVLREMDVVLEAFRKDQENNVPAASMEADRVAPKPAKRYGTLMHFLNRTQHKYS